MICFPLNNTEYEADALGAWCGTRTRGVFSADGHFDVTANGDMTVTVSPGLAWLKADTYWGVNAFEKNSTLLTIDTADGSLHRIDSVCVRLDKNMNSCSIVVKKGAYSSQTPAITPPVHNLDYDEICIATISVRGGATLIQQSDITDQRLNENFCGIMRDGVTSIPTQTLYEQFYSWFNDTKNVLNEDVAGNLLNMIRAHDNTVTVMTADEWNALDTAARAALYTTGSRLVVLAENSSGGGVILSLDADGGTRAPTQPAITSDNAETVRTALGLQNGAVTIVKWGNLSATIEGSTNLPQDVLFPTAFPNAALIVMATASTGNPRDISVSVSGISKDGFTTHFGNRFTNPRAAACYWLAIGR